MTSIIYVGMDVHTTNYTLCCYSMEDDRFFAEVQVEPDAKNILKYLARIEKQQSRGLPHCLRLRGGMSRLFIVSSIARSRY